jgi:hypothetical protein
MNSSGNASFKRRFNVSAKVSHDLRARIARDQDGVFEWRKIAALTKFEFLLKITREIVVAGKLDRRTKRRVSLYKNFTGRFSTSRASGDLREKLKRAFACAKIGQMQREICIDDSDQRHIRKMKTLRDHLCTDEDVDVACAEIYSRVSRYASLRVIESASMRRTTAFWKNL